MQTYTWWNIKNIFQLLKKRKESWLHFERKVSEEDKSTAHSISCVPSVCIAPSWTTYASLLQRGDNMLTT